MDFSGIRFEKKNENGTEFLKYDMQMSYYMEYDGDTLGRQAPLPIGKSDA